MDSKAENKNLLIVAGMGVVVSLGAYFFWRNNKEKAALDEEKKEPLAPQELIRINFAIQNKAKNDILQLVHAHRRERRKHMDDLSIYLEQCQQFEAQLFDIIEKNEKDVFLEKKISKFHYDRSVKASLEAEQPNEAQIILKQLAMHALPVLLRTIPPNREITIGEAKQMITCRVEFFKNEAAKIIKKLPADLSTTEAQYVLDNFVNDYTWNKLKLEYEDFAPVTKANMQFVIGLVQKEANNDVLIVKNTIYGLSWPTP